ncbi:MAG: hypothetical protein V3U75_11030 [Methylococcaceae bacterium]
MYDSNVPVQSLKTLSISMICAVLLAFMILVVVVGPAEYGIDPTGLGKKMGLTVLAKPLQQQEAKKAVACPTGEQIENWSDVVIITVPPASGLEYKFQLQQDAELTYTWSTDGGELYFDFHGEPAGDTSGYFKSYKETTDSQSKGTLAAPFTGIHGWYWENKSQNPVQVTLKTKGQYQIKGLI